jgi:CBS domain-containing protein
MNVERMLRHRRGPVVTCKPEDAAGVVAKLLAHHRIGALPVTDSSGALVGVISERDLVRGIALKGAAILAAPAKELMTKDVATCAPTDTAKEVMATMSRRHVRHLPVMEKGRLKDMLSQRDVMEARIEETRLEADVLRDAVRARA